MAVDHRRQPLQATSNRWVRLFSLLTKPSARLTDAADRRQAEILAVLQLFLVPIGIVVVSVRVVLQPDFIFVYLFVVATSVIGVVAYGLSRTHWARWGAWLQVALTGSTLFVAVFINPLDHTVYWYMALPVLFASVLLSVKECAVVSAAVLVGLGLLWLLWPP